MAVKLHRCGTMWLKIGAHPCWRVQRALDGQGIEYEVITHPLARGKRSDLERLTGQLLLPAIEFEDGSSYRAESKAMEQRVRSGGLFEEAGRAG
jgi:hypothetical protein